MENDDVRYMETIDAFDAYSSYEESTVASQRLDNNDDGDAEMMDVSDSGNSDEEEDVYIIDARNGDHEDNNRVGYAVGYVNNMEDLSEMDQSLAKYVEREENAALQKQIQLNLQTLEIRQLQVRAQMMYYEFLPMQVRQGLELLIQQFEPWLDHDVVPLAREEKEEERLIYYHWKLSGKYEDLFPLEIHVRIKVPINTDMPIPPPEWTLVTPCLPLPPYYYEEEEIGVVTKERRPKPLCRTMKILKQEVAWDGPQLLSAYLDYLLLPRFTMESFKELSLKLPWLTDLYYHSKISWALVGLHAGTYYEVRVTFALFTPEDVENRVMYYDSPVTTQMVREKHINYAEDPTWEILFQGRPRVPAPTPADFDKMLGDFRKVPLAERPHQWWHQDERYKDMMRQLHSDVAPVIHDSGYNYQPLLNPKQEISKDAMKHVQGIFIDPDLGIYRDVVQVYRRLCQLIYSCRNTDNPLDLVLEPTIHSDPRHEKRKIRNDQ